MKNLILISFVLILLSCSQDLNQKTTLDEDFKELIKKHQEGKSKEELQKEFDSLWEKTVNTPIDGGSGYSDTINKSKINFKHTTHVIDNKIDCNTCHQDGNKHALIPTASVCMQCHESKKQLITPK